MPVNLPIVPNRESSGGERLFRSLRGRYRLEPLERGLIAKARNIPQDGRARIAIRVNEGGVRLVGQVAFLPYLFTMALRRSAAESRLRSNSRRSRFISRVR